MPVTRILLLHEFGPTSRDWHQGRVAEELRGRGWEVVWEHGRLSDYRAGGAGGARLGNLLYCYLTFPWHLWRQRPAAVLVRTAPPGIQLWMSFWGALLETKVVWWLMDYHPELEARMLEERSGVGRVLARAFRAADRWTLDRTHGVIAIDEAMAEGVRRKSSKPRVEVHPTWSPETTLDLGSSAREAADKNTRTITILHLGNYGFAHDLSGLREVIAAASADWAFRLIVVNPSERGSAAFGALRELERVAVEFHPEQSFEELTRWIAEEGISCALVTLDPRFSGTVSPSKFHTYLDLHLPLLYLGPPGTNASHYCETYQAGITVPPQNPASALPTLEHLQTNPQARQDLLDGVQRAREAMHAYGAEGFCDLLEEMVGTAR